MSSIIIRTSSDLTTARNILRKRIASSKWTPPFRARATATLATLAELTIQSRVSLLLDMHEVSRPGFRGLQLHFDMPGLGSVETVVHKAETQLVSLTDELEFYPDTLRLRIIARLWLASDSDKG